MMEVLNLRLSGLSRGHYAHEPVVVRGGIVGTLVGVLPGLGPTSAIAILLHADHGVATDARNHFDGGDLLRRDVPGARPPPFC